MAPNASPCTPSSKPVSQVSPLLSTAKAQSHWDSALEPIPVIFFFRWHIRNPTPCVTAQPVHDRIIIPSTASALCIPCTELRTDSIHYLWHHAPRSERGK